MDASLSFLSSTFTISSEIFAQLENANIDHGLYSIIKNIFDSVNYFLQS